jgi:hypothetical protein
VRDLGGCLTSCLKKVGLLLILFYLNGFLGNFIQVFRIFELF